LENLYDNVDNTVWEIIILNINNKFSAKESPDHYEVKQHKPQSDKEHSKLLDRRKQAELQWLQNPSQMNGDHTDKLKHEASRTFRTKHKTD
jgi:hypothetical protein